MNSEYMEHAAQRRRQGIPPLALTPEQVDEVCTRLANPNIGDSDNLLYLLTQRVNPGVDPAARIKADFLAAIAVKEKVSPFISPRIAVKLLGTMMGGYNVLHLVRFLDDFVLAPVAAHALKSTILIFENFDNIRQLMERGNRFAAEVMQSWANAEWFTTRPAMPDVLTLKVYYVKGEVNTDDLSPASHAPTRPDIPLHALSMGESRFPKGIDKIRIYRAKGIDVAFAADTLGTGSSRKSATNSVIWHIGHDIPYVPNKRSGGVVLGRAIAPIFFNTVEDSGGLPICCNLNNMRSGRIIHIHLREGRITDRTGSMLSEFDMKPASLLDEARAGGRVPFMIGRELTARARETLGLGPSPLFAANPQSSATAAHGFTLAQKIVGRACGREGVLPGESCEPMTATVGSQDTTGPMTRDELTELACLSFQAGLTMQSFCHTAAYPKERDKTMHKTLPGFFTERGGVALRPGDGIIHSWLNRLLLPDTVGTGGDSHTRFPLGISFPAGSGLVAFAAALGRMPLDMPESVLVRLCGELLPGITLRDVVNAIPFIAIEQGLVDKPGAGARNVFNGRIMEIEGVGNLSVEQAFELSCASAERSAAAATVRLGLEQVTTYLRSNVALMESLVSDGYASSDTLRRRIDEVNAWLENPVLLERDPDAEFAATIDIDLAEIREPVVSCPNLPDKVELLSTIAGTKVDEVFIGSCMTNIAHFRAAARIFMEPDCEPGVRRLWVTPPTRMDREQLAREGVIQLFEKIGARVEIPGCSLCMGNQARVEDEAVVFSTSTRNFDNRMGRSAQVYLGSAELAAVVAKLGRIPTPAEYFEFYHRCIAPHAKEIYQYLDFSARA